MPRNVIDLAGVQRARALLDSAIEANPNVLDRLTIEDIEMIYQSELDTQVVSVRINRSLLQKLDRYSREQAIKRDERVSRNRIINELLDFALNHQTQEPAP